jgi:CBS domain containing-hemolysin-like protein
MMNDEPTSAEPPSSYAPAGAEGQRGGGMRRWLRGLRGLRNGRNGNSNLRETLEELIERHEERADPIDPRERQLLDKVLTLGNVTVSDIMVPRADIAAVSRDTPVDEVITLMAGAAHSRLPVYGDSLDDVTGMLHIKDVVAAAQQNKDVALSTLVRDILFVAPSMRVLDMLLQMRITRTHMALVVDEFGGVDGLLTIEDAVEQIVGEIEDEHDDAERPLFERRPDGDAVADARLPIEDFEAQLGSVLTEEERGEDIDTLGGLVISIAGRVPMRGEVLRHEESGLEFEVMDADPRRIRRLKICNLPQTAAADD